MSSMDKDGTQGQQTWRVPQISTCHAVRFGRTDDIVYCLTPNPQECGFALRFGSSFLCLHPKRGEIALRPVGT